MEQLSGLDASFLQQEQGNTFGHVSFLAIYDAASFGARGPYAAIRAAIEQRIHLVPLMRRRLAEIPFDLDLPYWIEDPDFDLDFHLRHVAVPPPGGYDQLSALVGRMIGRRLDRSRPLWELNVIESIEGGEVAILLKTHHAAIEGGSGAELLSVLLDTSIDREIPPAGEPPEPEPVPDGIALLQRTYASMMTSPQRLVRAQQNALRSVGELFMGHGETFNFSPFSELRNTVGLAESLQSGVRVPAVPSPVAPFNAPITAHRRIAWRSVELGEVRKIQRSAATTFDDVVVAICAGGLRRYLVRRGALPDGPLVALIPISVRTEGGDGNLQSRVAGTVVKIATHEEDPAARLAEVHEALADAREVHDAIPTTDVVRTFPDFSTPAVAAQASRMVASLRVADRDHPPFNLTISNVVGPPEPLYTAGAALKALIPALPVSEGIGLSITVVSYCDRLDFCLVSCRELVPDLDSLAEDLVAAFSELRAKPTTSKKRPVRKARKSRPLRASDRPPS
jgi:WS/DGAT/MGAT family acyltransferase